jgi:hypothetical protein
MLVGLLLLQVMTEPPNYFVGNASLRDYQEVRRTFFSADRAVVLWHSCLTRARDAEIDSTASPMDIASRVMRRCAEHELTVESQLQSPASGRASADDRVIAERIVAEMRTDLELQLAADLELMRAHGGEIVK